MNVNFELYRIFYVVANNGNITKASKELNITQPAVSKSIKTLEEQLGGQLFIRTKKGVILTEEGKEFYNYIMQAIECITSAENKFTDLINLETGCIKIGASTTLTKEFLLPYLEEFHFLYPNINIQIITGLTSDLIGKIKNGLIDMLILNINDKCYSNDVKIIKCKKVHDCFVANNSYSHLINKKIPIRNLNNYPLILQAKGSNTREFLDEVARKNNVILKPIIELASYTLVAEFSKIGFGIGYVAKEHVENAIKNGTLIEIKTKEEIPERYIGIALSKNHMPSFGTKKLIEIINQNSDKTKSKNKTKNNLYT